MQPVNLLIHLNFLFPARMKDGCIVLHNVMLDNPWVNKSTHMNIWNHVFDIFYIGVETIFKFKKKNCVVFSAKKSLLYAIFYIDAKCYTYKYV